MLRPNLETNIKTVQKKNLKTNCNSQGWNVWIKKKKQLGVKTLELTNLNYLFLRI